MIIKNGELIFNYSFYYIYTPFTEGICVGIIIIVCLLGEFIY